MSKDEIKKASIEKDVYEPRTGEVVPGMALTVTKAPPPKAYIEKYEKISRPKEPIFPCPDAKWEDVSISLLADDMILLKTPNGEGRFTYHQLEMQDKRKGDRYGALWAFLQLLAKRKGYITRENTEYDRRLQDTARRFDIHLRNVFGIPERIYKGHYKKEKGYRTRIRFYDRTYR